MATPSPEFLDLQSALAGEYSLERELGRGGMGIVYLAREVLLDRDVAIKVLPTLLARNPAARERFLREARMAASLSHPHIVPIHRVGEAGGFVFFVMSYVEGETLGERIRNRGPLSPAEASRIVREVAWALAYAHGRGIIHRDVKPDNILLEAATGRALVTDFGIAYGGKDGPNTDPGKIMGTVAFMSPEQAAGEPIDGRSDIYALGVVGFLAVSGRLPIDSTNRAALILRKAGTAAPSVSQAAPGLPPAFSEAIDRCLARLADDRFSDGEALAAALAPATDARPALPPTLRAWLATRNPMMVPYLAWFGLFGTLTTGNIIAWLGGNRGADPLLLAAITAAPLLPIIGFHLNKARRQFRAGHTLADLRTALEVARRERAEVEASVRDAEPPSHSILRVATASSAGWLAVTFFMLASGYIHENAGGAFFLLAPVFSTLALGAISNALDVRFIPTWIGKWWQEGIRTRLWNSRVGEWVARWLGAPQRSKLAGSSAFRATESALGVAASQLFDALPRAYKEQLAELPALVASLEARAAEARADADLVSNLVPGDGADAEVLAARKRAAASHLADAVAALEGIRLDLLRLHAGAADLAPLTTLIDAARLIGEDVGRLADAQQEVEDATRRRLGAGRTPTPV